MIVGAGGHGRVVAEAVELGGAHLVVGFVDRDPGLHGRAVGGLRVLGGDELLGELVADGVTGFVIGVGSVGDASVRAHLYEHGLTVGLTPVTVVHPTAAVSPSARLGSGTVVLAGAIVNAGAAVGDNVIINSQVVVEHDCVIGDHVHVATGAQLASGVRVGAGAHIGAGATVIQGCCVGAAGVVGAGAVVIRDVADATTVVGCPARPIRRMVRRGAGSGGLGQSR